MIREKIIINYTILVIVLAAMLVLSYNNMERLQNELNNFTGESLNQQMKVNNLAGEIAKLSNIEQSYIITGSQVYLNQYEEQKNEIDSTIKDLQKIFAKKKSEKEIIDTIDQFYHNYLMYSNRVLKSRNQSGLEAAQRIVLVGTGTKAMSYVDINIEKMNTTLAKKTKKEISALENRTEFSMIIFFTLTLISIILVIVTGTILYRTMKKNTYKINHSILEMANAGGDLTKRVEVKTKDEFSLIASSTNVLIESIATLIRKVSSLTENVSASGQQLTASAQENAITIQQIANSTTEIADSSEKTIRSMDISSQKMSQLEETTLQLNNDAQLLRETSTNMQKAAKTGHTSVQQSAQAMMEIEETIANTNQTITGLGESSKEITSIIGTITSIAGQTNLLALNAAIEAARAGVHGKGFAVVADEVRKLAEQSQLAAREVSEIVHTIQNEIATIVSQNEEGVKMVIQGVEVTNATISAFDAIAKETEKTIDTIGNMVERIAQTEEVSSDVMQSFIEVTSMAEHTAHQAEQSATAAVQGSASIQEIYASSEELSKQADSLRDVVQQFKI
ncbi:MAG: CHASE3 domain-containing protein [Kurthia sp.]|nr:CHASE3 domain-containing protein [Candidatus Kurthia equi]